MISEKITTRQAILLIITTRMSIALSIMPAINLPPYNQDIWIMVLFSIIYTFILMVPLLYLANKFTRYSIVGYMKIIFGKTIGKILGILYALYFIMISINGIAVQSELVATGFLQGTSNFLIVGIMIMTCLYFVIRGIINIFTASELLSPIPLLTIILLLIFGFSTIDYSVLLPVLKESSFKDMNLGALQLVLYYSDIFLLVMLVPKLENKKDINKIFFTTTIVSMSLLAMAIIVVFGLIGVESSRHSNYPFLLYTRAIKGFKSLERIDPLFIVSWLITVFMRIAGFLYLATSAIKEAFNIDRKGKPIVFMVGGISGLVSLLILNQESITAIKGQLSLLYSFLFAIFAIFIPILACIVYIFRRKSIDKQS